MLRRNLAGDVLRRGEARRGPDRAGRVVLLAEQALDVVAEEGLQVSIQQERGHPARGRGGRGQEPLAGEPGRAARALGRARQELWDELFKIGLPGKPILGD